MSAQLTTSFTPPARCTTEMWRMTNSDTREGPYYGLLGGGGYASCMPRAFTPDPSFFYSPGFYCPMGYYTACSLTQAIGSETATIATCCPSSVTHILYPKLQSSCASASLLATCRMMDKLPANLTVSTVVILARADRETRHGHGNPH
jgi:hypothetical protein